MVLAVLQESQLRRAILDPQAPLENQVLMAQWVSADSPDRRGCRALWDPSVLRALTDLRDNAAYRDKRELKEAPACRASLVPPALRAWQVLRARKVSVVRRASGASLASWDPQVAPARMGCRARAATLDSPADAAWWASRDPLATRADPAYRDPPANRVRRASRVSRVRPDPRAGWDPWVSPGLRARLETEDCQDYPATRVLLV